MSANLFCFLVFNVSPYVIWAGLALAFVRPMRLGRWRSAGGLALFALALSKTLLYKVFGGHPHYPDLPESFCVVTGIAFSFCAILFVLSLLPPYRNWRRRALVCSLLALGITAWGAYEAMRIPEVRRREIVVEGLARSFDGMRLVHLSDLHCGPSARRDYVKGVVDRVNSLHPDVICITGDFVDGKPKLRAEDMEPLAELRAKWGVFGCVGNHECYSRYWLWRPIFAKMGVRMLENSHVVITNGTGRLALGGVMDKSAAGYFMDDLQGKRAKDGKGRKRRRWPRPNVQEAFSNAPPEACRILLSHRPINTFTNAMNGVKLQLSGHTHGAPVWGTGWLIGMMNEGHSAGLYRENGLALYVTSGAGQWVGFPMRLGVPSEIAEITLRSKPAQPQQGL